MSQLKTHKLNVQTLPLQGIQLIEASAGTGKTWTLAALYVRLILGHGWSGDSLMPPQILVMTFTEAATAELRDRIRERLAQAAQFFRGQTQFADDFLFLNEANVAHDVSSKGDSLVEAIVLTVSNIKRSQSHILESHIEKVGLETIGFEGS